MVRFGQLKIGEKFTTSDGHVYVKVALGDDKNELFSRRYNATYGGYDGNMAPTRFFNEETLVRRGGTTKLDNETDVTSPVVRHLSDYRS